MCYLRKIFEKTFDDKRKLEEITLKYTCCFILGVSFITWMFSLLTETIYFKEFFVKTFFLGWSIILCFLFHRKYKFFGILITVSFLAIAFGILIRWGFINPFGLIILLFVMNINVVINSTPTFFRLNILSIIFFVILGILQMESWIQYDSSWLAHKLMWSDLIFVTLFLFLIVFIIWIDFEILHRRFLKISQLSKQLEEYNKKLQLEVIEKTKTIIKVNSELEESNKILRLAYQQLGKSDKNRFIRLNMLAHYGSVIYSIVHNMANPMMVIMHYCEKSKFESPRERRKVMNAIQILTQMIKTARESLRISETREIFSPTQIIESINSILLNKANRFHIQMKWTGDKNLGNYCVVGNKSKFSQIIINLIDNAIDATKEKEEKKILIKYFCDEEIGVFRIQDTGVGILDTYVERIFQLFYTSKEDGNGVGLYIAKKFAKEEFGGDVTLIDNNDGTTFEFRFKIKKC